MDYSRSMENNIKVLFRDLDVVIDSLQNVLLSGRTVKVGVVIFNKPGNSQIASFLSSNFDDIQNNVLGRLLRRYISDTTFIEPGEAYYLGVRKAKDLGWQSQNRQIIVITDEESYLLATGQSNLVREIRDEMKEFNVYPIIVRLCD